MDFISQLGELALGSRLRRMSDRIMADGADIYSYAQLPFEPRWFPIYRFLAENERVTLAHIARELGITHPSVHQTLAEMSRAKLVSSYRDPTDKRKRLIALSKQGRALLPRIRPVWDDIRSAMNELVRETGVDLLAVMARMEELLDQERFAERFRRHHRAHHDSQVEIITYDPAYRESFEALNRQWIEFYFEVESADEKVFAQPEKYILEPGGQIFFARDVNTGKILGTVALIKRPDGRFEMAKMAVDSDARGRQIGERLSQALIETARAMNLEEIMLLSNTKLVPAINLYRKLGFVEVHDVDLSEYRRANICMIYRLTPATQVLERELVAQP